MKELYITDDGLTFLNKDKALLHEKTLKIKRFESHEAMIDFFKKTYIWKKWEDNLDVDKHDVITLKQNVDILAANLSVEFPEVFIQDSDMAENLVISLWERHFEPEAVIAYFTLETTGVILGIPEEKVLEVYHETGYFNECLSDRLDEFTKFIGVLIIGFGRRV